MICVISRRSIVRIKFFMSFHDVLVWHFPFFIAHGWSYVQVSPYHIIRSTHRKGLRIMRVVARALRVNGELCTPQANSFRKYPMQTAAHALEITNLILTIIF